MPSSRYRLAPLLTLALTSCSGSQDPNVAQAEKVRSALERRLAISLDAAPEVVTTATLSNVLGVYSTRTRSERILLVVFDSPAATRQILGERGRLEGSEVLRHGNVVVLHTLTKGSTSRAAEIRQALASAVPR